MANLEISGAVKRTQKGSSDWYYGGDNEAWADLAAAKAGVPSAIRPGKTVGVYVSGEIVEYWWPDATNIADGDLVVKETPLPQPLDTTDTPTFASIHLAGSVHLANNARVTALDTASSDQSLFYLDPSGDLQIGDAGVSAVRFHSGVPVYVDGSAVEIQNNKNAANGYAGLDSSGKVASAQLPSYVDDVLEVANYAALPGTGETGKIYVTLDTNYEYRWSGSTYIQLVASPGSTDAVAEGSINLYFTAARVLGVLLSGITFGTVSAVTATDSILIAMGKLQAQVSDLSTNKVDKITGKGLSTNDYTTAEQTKLSGIATGATANSAATLTEAETGTDTAKFIVSSVLAGWWTWVKTQAATISGAWNFTGGLQSGGNTVETQNNKDATGGYAGLTLFKINFKNAANTFISYFTNSNTASRTYTFQDRNGTILDDTDKTALNSAIALKDNAAIGFNDQSGTAYTVVLTDASQKIRMNNAAANVVTIPLNSSVAFPVGSYFYVSMQGAGQTSIVGASGVTVQGVTTVIDVQYNEALVWKEATDTWKVIGIAPDVSAIDGPNASIKRTSTLSKITASNAVNSVGGFGNAVTSSSTSQYFTGPDTGLPAGAGITMTLSHWLKTSSGSTYDVINYGNLLIQHLFNSVAIIVGGVNLGAIGYSGSIRDGAWHNMVVAINGTAATLYVDNVAYAFPTLTSYTVTLNGTFANSLGLTSQFALQGSTDQLAIYNRTLSTTSGSGGTNEISAIWNGGTGTQAIPQSGLIRWYKFQDGTGTTATDSNPTGTHYSVTLTGGMSWAGVGNGKIPLAGTFSSVNYMSVSDGVYAGESSTVSTGDVLSGNERYGKTIRNIINSIVTYVSTTSGHFFSKTNTNGTKASASCVDIDGNLTIGSTYAGTNAAPTNGSATQGRALFGTSTDNVTDQVQISGNLNLVTAGNKIKIATGTNASIGTATLVAGTVTVSTTAVTASSKIFMSRNTPGGTTGSLSVPTGSITAGTSFVINSDNAADTSTVNWWIIN